MTALHPADTLRLNDRGVSVERTWVIVLPRNGAGAGGTIWPVAVSDGFEAGGVDGG